MIKSSYEETRGLNELLRALECSTIKDNNLTKYILHRIWHMQLKGRNPSYIDGRRQTPFPVDWLLGNFKVLSDGWTDGRRSMGITKRHKFHSWRLRRRGISGGTLVREE